MDEGTLGNSQAWDLPVLGTPLAMEHEGGGLNALLPDGTAATGLWRVHAYSRPAPSARQKGHGKVEAVRTPLCTVSGPSGGRLRAMWCSPSSSVVGL